MCVHVRAYIHIPAAGVQSERLQHEKHVCEYILYAKETYYIQTTCVCVNIYQRTHTNACTYDIRIRYMRCTSAACRRALHPGAPHIHVYASYIRIRYMRCTSAACRRALHPGAPHIHTQKHIHNTHTNTHIGASHPDAARRYLLLPRLRLTYTFMCICICKCKCIYIYIYIYTYIHTYIHIHIHIYVYTHTHTHMYVYS